jgi:uncharacterized protein (DUF488 family)
MTIPVIIYTIGHSTHSTERFFELLRPHGVTAIADVRSVPFSRYNPQFNLDLLSAASKECGIEYVFVGKELGARSDDPSCYERGRVRYDRLAKAPTFQAGIERVLRGARKYRLVLMCAEKEPLDCHRTLLVSRELERRGTSIVHILADGSSETQERTMSRLLDMVGLPEVDLFRTREELVSAACELREEKIAYVDDALARQEPS